MRNEHGAWHPCGACGSYVSAASGCEHWKPANAARVRQREYEHAARERARKAVQEFTRVMTKPGLTGRWSNPLEYHRAWGRWRRTGYREMVERQIRWDREWAARWREREERVALFLAGKRRYRKAAG